MQGGTALLLSLADAYCLNSIPQKAGLSTPLKLKVDSLDQFSTNRAESVCAAVFDKFEQI